MNIKLPTFIELYRQLIATPSISATDAKTDQSNEALINLLANWLKHSVFQLKYNQYLKPEEI